MIKNIILKHKALLYYLLLFPIFVMACKQKKTPQDLSRTETATFEKQAELIKLLESTNIDFLKMEVFLRAFKSEEILEIWAKNREGNTFKKIIEYPFCVNSGNLGPKRKEGDKQIPEGVYHINRFNPNSQFYLSLGLNYPNRSDKKFADVARPGSDIFIHGGCASVGCISITDDKIKELWILTNQAKDNGQSFIETHIFPIKMTANNLELLKRNIPQHHSFWGNLQPVFEYFEVKKQIPKVRVNADGRYFLL